MFTAKISVAAPTMTRSYENNNNNRKINTDSTMNTMCMRQQAFYISITVSFNNCLYHNRNTLSLSLSVSGTHILSLCVSRLTYVPAWVLCCICILFSDIIFNCDSDYMHMYIFIEIYKWSCSICVVCAGRTII